MLRYYYSMLIVFKKIYILLHELLPHLLRSASFSSSDVLFFEL